MDNVFDKFDIVMRRERELASQSACRVHHWIISSLDGERLVKPYTCKTCDRCKENEILEVMAAITSIAFLNRVGYMKVRPRVADVIIKKLRKDDYVRFPSNDDFDYIFALSHIGNEFFEVYDTIDWKSILDRKTDRKRTGLLITRKEEPAKLVIETSIIRVDTREHAIEAVEFAVKFFKGSDITENEIVDLKRLKAVNNSVNNVITSYLSENGWLVHTSRANKEAHLPITFDLRLEM